MEIEERIRAALAAIINKKTTRPHVVRMIAEHPEWSLRYSVKLGLIRNFHTPMKHVVNFIGRMKTPDLKDLYSDPKLPTATKPYIFSELTMKKETTDVQKQEIYTLNEEDDGGLLSMNGEEET